ncbi:MAG: AmmeMemoRadiSam system protein B [Alphaproteobacteria bacterium]
MTMIRQPAVAGAFYPGTPDELGRAVAGYLDAAAADGPIPKAIIVPHAGYIYSAATAARAFARLKPAADTIRRVVLLGPCHRVAVRGLALSSSDAFATPLGDIPLDKTAATRIAGLPQVQVFDATHAPEHSLEVQLPFLQAMLNDFSLLPLVVGDATPDEVAEVLDIVWGGTETLIVISTDLSHYLDYDSARRLDGATCRAIEALDSDVIGDDQACGRMPLKGLLNLAKRRNMRIETLGLCNSGDTAGDRDRVVGYGAWGLFEATT